MFRKGSIQVIILIVLFIISALTAAGVFYFYQKEHAKNIQLQSQLDELTVRQRVTEGKLSEAKKIAAEFQLKVQEAKSQINVLTDELNQEKSAHLDVSNKLDQINADLEQQKTLRQDLENRLKQSEDAGKIIKDQIKIITKEKTVLEEKIKNLESGVNGVELGKVVVNPDNLPVNPPVKSPTKVIEKPPVVKFEKKIEPALIKPLEGKVAVVNKEYNFAVINLGSKDGVKLLDEFSVVQSGKVIGSLKVEKVHESMSAAGFGPELKDNIKENDVVQKVK